MTRKRPSDETPQDPNRTPGDAEIIPLPENFLAHIRTGADIAAMPRMQWLLKGRIPKGGLIALYAPPKSGKSVVATELAVSAALGEYFWQVPFGRPLRVLYIAAERYIDIADRLKATLHRRGVAYPDTLHLYARETGPLQVSHGKHFAALLQVAEHLKPDLIIFDTFARMTLGLEENSSGAMGEAVEQFLAVLRAAGPGCAGVIVHHEGKDKQKGARGSTAFLGAVDGAWRVWREVSGSRVSYTLELEALNAGALPPPEHFNIVGELMPGYEDSTPVLEWQSFSEYANARDKWLVEKLTEAGAEGMTKKAMHEAYNAEHDPKKASDTVAKWLSDLVKCGHAEKSEGSKKGTRYYAKGLAPK